MKLRTIYKLLRIPALLQYILLTFFTLINLLLFLIMT